MIVNRQTLKKDEFNKYDWEYREIGDKIVLTDYVGVSENVVFPKGDRFLVANSLGFGPMRSIIKSIDFNNISFQSTSFFIGIRDMLDKLESVTNLGPNVKNYQGAFNGVTTLKHVGISDGAEDFTGAFTSCGLEEPVDLPDSTLYMNAAYYQSPNLRKTGAIPPRVVELESTFHRTKVEHGADLSNHKNFKSLNGCYSFCTELEDTGELPDSVFNMAEAYSHCWKLSKTSKLPEQCEVYFMTFYDCSEIKSQPALNKKAKILFGTFDQCTRLIYAKEIPYGAITTCCMYAGCIRLEVGADVPDTVINCSDMYNGCVKLKHGVKIGHSAILADNMYLNCHTMVSSPDLPDNIKTANSMFMKCYRLQHAPQIGRVVSAFRMFAECVSMQTAPIIPETAVDIAEMFAECKNLSGDIVILSKSIEKADGLFNGLMNSKYHKTVYVDFNSLTYQTLVKTGLTECQELYNIEIAPLERWLNGKN